MGDVVPSRFAPLPTPSTQVELFSVAGADGFLRQVNATFADLLALGPEELEDRSLLELVHPQDVPQVVAALASLSAGDPEVMVENRFARSDGTWVHLQWVARPIPDSDLWWAAGRDTTVVHRLRSDGVDLRARLDLAAGGVAAMWQLDTRTGLLSWEDQAAALLGVEQPDLPDAVSGFARLVGDDGVELEAAFADLVVTGQMEHDVAVRSADGSQRHLSVRGTVLERDRRSRPLRAVGLVLDITTSKAMEEQMLRMVLSDALTGAPNRRAFDQALRVGWRQAARTDQPLSVLIIDIDDFKKLNDTHGHLVGDAALTAVWRALEKVTHRAGDTAARFGGEEFAVVLPDVDVSGALTVAARCCEAVRSVQVAQAPEWRLTVSIGTATRSAGRGPASVSELLLHADQALYAAKASGKDRATAFEIDLAGDAATEELIRQGLRAREFQMHYQPVIDVTTGTVTSFEALMRWNRPGHGVQGPDTFIPLAERGELICDIGRYALGEALAEAGRWQRAAAGVPTVEPIKVAVNLSGRHLADPGVVEDIRSALENAGLPATSLIVELTETALVDETLVGHHLAEIRQMGVAVAIDDFGTGYTSVGQLPHLPADVLKIDRSFIASHEARTRDLVALMTAAGHAFDLRVVAEGVETSELLDWLRGLGCDEAQGYVIARPMPGAEVLAWITRQPADA